MPYRITLECPIDGLPLVNNAVVTLRGGPADETTTHVHLNLPNAPMSCANGHTWRFTTDETLQMTRFPVPG